MNGTLNGTATIAAGGRFGNCLSVTGDAANSGSCRIANAVVPLNVGAGNTWTVAMWVKTATPGGAYAYQGGGGWAEANTMFYLNPGNASAGTKAGGVRWGQNWETGTADINDNQWHHVVLTCDGTTKAMYLDGNLETFTANGWNGAGTGNQFWVGGSGQTGDGGANLNGFVDEVYVFNRALTLADVQLLYSNNTVPKVPVSVVANPASGYRGQFVTLTATATPVIGTVTNARADLSAIGLSASATMGQSSANVFTNSFTVPTNAPVGAANLRVTVTSTEPLIGSSGATYTVLARPPTNAIIVTQLTNSSAYEYTKASFYFGTTNDAPNDAPFPMTYSWYKNGQLVSTNPMGPYYSFLTTLADNGSQIYAIARVADTNFSSLSRTSAVVTLTVLSGTPVFTNGLKQEFFAGATRADVHIGNVGPGVVGLVTNADSSGGFGDNHSRRYSGYFIPPATDDYVFFVASDDDCDVFLSTDSSPANKRLIAQELVWSPVRSWQTPGPGTPGPFEASQKRSDQWSPDPQNGVPAPYSAGIHLIGGQKYYFESVMHNGTGGDNWAVTYQTTTELGLEGAPANGTASRMTAASNNIAVITYPGSALTWALQPPSAVTVYEGASTNFISRAISDAEMNPTYQWYLNNVPIAGAVGANLTISTIPTSYNGAQVKVVARLPESSLSITSSVSTITVLQAVFEPGFLKVERWSNQSTLTALLAGTLGTPNYQMAVPAFAASIDNPNLPNNFVRRVSGFFVPPQTANYVFYTTGDDATQLFISTDNTPGNKRLVAQQAGWNTGGNWAWLQIGGGGGIADQTRSTTWTPDNGVTYPYANGIPLNGGQRYYIEQVFQQGGGGANNAATFVLFGEPDPLPGTETRFKGNLIGTTAVRNSGVTLTQQPTNTTVKPMGYATFSVNGTTESSLSIGSIFGGEENQTNNFLIVQWYKNGTAIPGATSRTVTLGPIMPSDNGAEIRAAVRALGFANQALNPIWVTSAVATVTVAPEAVFETGVLLKNWWTNTTRPNIEAGLAGLPQYTYTTPKLEGPVGNTGMRGYGTSGNGFFIPPTTGFYTFFINSDGDSDLFLSTDSNPANKRKIAAENIWSNPFQWNSAGAGGAVAIAQKRSDQFVDATGAVPNAGGISLNAGQRYYIEAVYRAGGGNDHVQVTYKLINDPDPLNGSAGAMSGDVIGIYAPRIPWVAFLQHPTNQTVLSGGNPVTFSATGTNPPSLVIGTTGNPSSLFTNPPTASLQYQWYKNGNPIPGATARTYTQSSVLPSDNGAQFHVAIRALGYADNALNRIWSNSMPAVLNVVTDAVPPMISYAATFENSSHVPFTGMSQFIVNVTFSKWMDATTLSNIANYSIAGVTITNISVASDHRTVQLLVNQLPTLPLNVVVSGVKDLSGNTIVAGSSSPINNVKLTFTDVGTPAVDPAYPSLVSVTGAGGFIITAQGSDIWNTADGFNFAWELKTNDFDVAVRQVSNGHSSHWAKGGLMVRESLDPSSRNWNIINDPASSDGIMAPDNSGFGANVVESNARIQYGGATAPWDNITRPAVAYPNAWVRLKRTGAVLQAFYSTNGVNWIQTAFTDTSTNAFEGPLVNPVYVGLCTTARNNVWAGLPPPTPLLYYNTVEYANYNSSFVVSAPAAQLTVSRSGNSINVSWTPAGGHLEFSPAIGGPNVNWQPVGGGNPASVPLGTGSQFFRVVNP